MNCLGFNDKQVEALSNAMQTTDPDEQLELFPHLLVMFMRGCDVKEKHSDHNRYDPKQVTDKIDRFVTKHKDIYTRKEVVITAPIKLD
jgi:hypothetical protein